MNGLLPVILGYQNQNVDSAIRKQLKKELKALTRTDGYSSPSWIIIDTGEIMIHLFHKKTREYYNLESLWSDKK